MPIMLKSLEVFLLSLAVIVAIIACNLSQVDDNPRYKSLYSKVELISEEYKQEDKFSGNTTVNVSFKNNELLNQEQDLKVRRRLLKPEEKKTDLPPGGQIEIKLEAASEENADLYKIEIWLTNKGERKRYLPADCEFVQGPKFSHTDEQYNLKIYNNLVKIGLIEKSVEPLALEIIDNNIGKTTKFAIYPYFNK